MKRLVFSALLALGLHAILFWTQLPWGPPRLVVPHSRAVNIELVALHKPQLKKSLPTEKSEVKKKKRPLQTLPKPNLKPKPASRPKPKSKPKPAAKPKAVPKPPDKTIVLREQELQQTNSASPPLPATPAPAPDIIPESEVFETETVSRLPEDDEKVASTENSEAAEVIASIPLYHLNPPPSYPRAARKRNYQGLVLLDVRVSEDGIAAEVRVAQSSGYAVLDRSAVKTVTRWRFTPARRGDQHIEMWVQVPVRFKLR